MSRDICGKNPGGHGPVRLSALVRYRHGIGMSLRHSVAAALAAAVLSAAPGPAGAAEYTHMKIGDTPPTATLRDLNGNRVQIPDHFREKVVVLHFWAAGCSSCREELAAMESLHKAYYRKGLTILAVNVGQGKEIVLNTVRSIGMSYQVLLDTDGGAARKYEALRLPKTVIIDRQGTIRYKIVGEATGAFLKKRILSLL